MCEGEKGTEQTQERKPERVSTKDTVPEGEASRITELKTEPTREIEKRGAKHGKAWTDFNQIHGSGEKSVLNEKGVGQTWGV